MSDEEGRPEAADNPDGKGGDTGSPPSGDAPEERNEGADKPADPPAGKPADAPSDEAPKPAGEKPSSGDKSDTPKAPVCPHCKKTVKGPLPPPGEILFCPSCEAVVPTAPPSGEKPKKEEKPDKGKKPEQGKKAEKKGATAAEKPGKAGPKGGKKKGKASAEDVKKAAGVKQVAYGVSNGEDKVSMEFQAYIGAPESYDAVYIDGVQKIRVVIEGGTHGDLATASVVVNSIPRVIEARPGLITMADLAVVSALPGR